MTTEVSARSDYGLHYVHASEDERLDYERRYFPTPQDHAAFRFTWYQHVQSYQPWSHDEARHYRATASACLRSHDHNLSDRDPLTRENCGACVLQGYKPRGGWGDPASDAPNAGPNYSGWARIYVEDGATIPAKWREAFADQGHDYRAYYDALGRSIVTFGVRFGE